MQTVWLAIAGVLLCIGIFFAAAGVIGILRLPDFYARSQASTCVTTLGALAPLLAGVILSALIGLSAVAYVKLVIIAALILISSAVSAHALAKGAYKRGRRPSVEGFVKDDYKEESVDAD